MSAYVHTVEGYIPDKCVIWKFLPFSKFVAALSKGLWFARIDTLGDEHEGFASEPYLRSLESRIRDLPDDSKQLLKGIPDFAGPEKTFYVNCWHVKEHELDFMWKIYTSEEGVAIETTFAQLETTLKSVPNCKAIALGLVKYYEANHQEEWGNPDYTSCLRKRKIFEPEHELRAIIDYRLERTIATSTPSVEEAPHSFVSRMTLRHEDENGRDITFEELESIIDRLKGFYVEVDQKLLINKVVLPPKAPPWLVESVHFVRDRAGLRAEIVDSEICKPPPALRI